jgi:macrodomain Ter protein organizer (MatP/YcbG family)
MTKHKLEERVAVLERQVQQLMESNSSPRPVKDWRRSVGKFSGNELMKEIDRAGQAIRARERRQAQRGNVKRRRRAKS